MRFYTLTPKGVTWHQYRPPKAVTAAWYAQDCPPVLDKSELSRWTLVHWWLWRKMRGLP